MSISRTDKTAGFGRIGDLDGQRIGKRIGVLTIDDPVVVRIAVKGIGADNIDLVSVIEAVIVAVLVGGIGADVIFFDIR